VLQPPCISIKDLCFSWRSAQADLVMSDFSVRRGEKLFLCGDSGSGKSTLAGLIAGVLAADAGEVTVLGQPFHRLAAAARDRVRADAIGLIFQQFNLVPYLTLAENVLLPCRFSSVRAARTGPDQSSRRAAAFDLLDRLGLGAEARDGRAASALSVGQQQRVAAARALIGSPPLIIADEPTSALDAASRDAFIDILINEARDATVLFVSHDTTLAPRFERMETMSQLTEDAAPAADRRS